jgi:8-oxo-dGTP pyrophosphatase MutT (NUDIX family)
MTIHGAVYGVILDENKRVLLIHRTDNDIWEIPGGGWEEGETPWDAVTREVKEETGLDVVVSHLVSIGSRPTGSDLVFTFLCAVSGGEISITDSEVDQITYFALSDFPANIAPSKLARIQDALQFQDQCFLRDITNSVKTQDYIAKNNL